MLCPGLFMMNTIMLREHNRVCVVMKKEHPEWDDEQLFQTTKNIIVGGFNYIKFWWPRSRAGKPGNELC